MIDVNITGHTNNARQVRLFGKNLAFAVARALTYTARDIKAAEIAEMKKVFDRPTAYTLNSLFITPAQKTKLNAKTWVKDDRAAGKTGTPANRFLLPNVESGKRGQKRVERALQKSGFLPDGWITAAGQGATLDAHGNISRSQIAKIMSQLRVDTTNGKIRHMQPGKKGIAAQRTAGGSFFVVKPGQGTQPGIYQREFTGRNITPVLIFARQATYKARFDFYDTAQKTIKSVLGKNIDASIVAAYDSDKITVF